MNVNYYLPDGETITSVNDGPIRNRETRPGDVLQTSHRPYGDDRIVWLDVMTLVDSHDAKYADRKVRYNGGEYRIVGPDYTSVVLAF